MDEGTSMNGEIEVDDHVKWQDGDVERKGFIAHISDDGMAHVQALRKRLEMYEHRNGETEKPTIEGLYFVKHIDGWYMPSSSVMYVEKEEVGFEGREGYKTFLIVYRCGSDNHVTLDELDNRLQWWGPVVPPWEAENAT
jgi:hypothetical protein